MRFKTVWTDGTVGVRHSNLTLFALGLACAATLWMAWTFFRTYQAMSDRRACITNLMQMQGAKDSWAMETKAPETAIPKESEIFGSDRYIRNKLTCPVGGEYSLGPVQVNATCSIPGHALRPDPSALQQELLKQRLQPQP